MKNTTIKQRKELLTLTESPVNVSVSIADTMLFFRFTYPVLIVQTV